MYIVFFFVLCVYYFKFYYIKSYDTYAFFSPENFLRCNRGRALTLFGMHYVVPDWLCPVAGDTGDYEKFKLINGDTCISMHFKKTQLGASERSL